MWGGLSGAQLKLPLAFGKLQDGSSYSMGQIVSLACRPGMLVTRVVYKMLTEGYDGVILGTGGIPSYAEVKGKYMEYEPSSYVSPVRRCKLQLPPHDKRAAKDATSKSEVDAALRSKEVDCKHAYMFGKLKAGQWYSDTATFDFGGCSTVTKAAEKGRNQHWANYNADYDHAVPSVVHNPGVAFLLAKFEVQELW
jgi:hypothetical protein